jgi:hypothetical protein
MIGGMFFAPKLVTVKPPQFASIPPQIHQQKTTFCAPFFAKNPCKNTEISTQKKITKLRMVGFPEIRE